MNKISKNFNDYIELFPELETKLKSTPKYEVSTLFANKGPKTILNELPIGNTDFKGLYAFWDKDEVVYVGISKNVIQRIHQHVRSTTHYSATLAVKMMKLDGNPTTKKSRNEYTKDEIREIQTERLNKMSVSFISFDEIAENHIDNDTKLYLFEVYCAITFKCKYNTFETRA